MKAERRSGDRDQLLLEQLESIMSEGIQSLDFLVMRTNKFFKNVFWTILRWISSTYNWKSLGLS